MRTVTTLTIVMFFALTLFSPARAQQSGGSAGLKIMDADPEGMCKDEPVSTGVSKKNIQRQAELARELTAMLKRTVEIQKKLAAGAGKDVQAELSRMIERTGQMTTELQGMTSGSKTP